MNTLFLIIIATGGLSLIAFIAALVLAINKHQVDKVLYTLVSLAAGTMLGGAFLHLLPEAIEGLSAEIVFKATLFSIVGFYILERFMHWHHSQHGKDHLHSLGYMNLIGDLLHNFIDGLVIAGAFMTDINLGLITLLALALHEIPQELSDFGVLIYSGFSRKKAVIFNFLAGLSSVIGGVLGYYLSYSSERFVLYLLPIAAGGFIYIATSDLVPEIKKHTDPKKAFIATCMFLAGITIIFLLGIVE